MSAEWQASWRAAVAEIMALDSFSSGAFKLQELLRMGVLRQTDLRDAPERFFMAHAILSEYATAVGPGFGIRFTVQFNLFAGTILALGNAQQVASLDDMQAQGRLGCFCLTERLAGVNSGLVVNTVCEWDHSRRMFVLNCPNPDSEKIWISQGLTADMAVVVATLIVDGRSLGPHAFLMELRREGSLVPGVTEEDMGAKTIGNDLDNARLSFHDVMLPRAALLDRYATISADGTYCVHGSGTNSIDMIGQRLYTGRAVIAASTLVFTRTLFRSTRAYANCKACWHPKLKLSLSDVPQVADVFLEAEEKLSRVEALGTAVQDGLCRSLRDATHPDVRLVEMVAAFKVRAVETSIDLCHRLRQEVGSYALMEESGFGRTDYLQCCKFAEGDSRILMQKIARDRLQAYSRDRRGTEAEQTLCHELGEALLAGGGMKAWTANWKLVYRLADTVIDRIVDEATMASKL